MESKELPLISVCITTYNVDAYIKKALDGIAEQVFNGLLEIVVVDDASTDRSVQEIEDWKKDFSGQLTVWKNQVNEGAMSALIRSIELAQAPYLAILDGDDYWIDPLKLQKQYDFLSVNPAYSLVWHDATYVDELGRSMGKTFGERFKGRDYDSEFSLSEVLRWRVLGPTSSIFVRKTALKFPQWAPEFYGTEVMLFLITRQQGLFKYFPSTCSVYRVRPGSRETVMTKLAKTRRNLKDYGLLYEGFFPFEKKFLEKKLLRNHLYICFLQLKSGRFYQAFINFCLGLYYLGKICVA